MSEENQTQEEERALATQDPIKYLLLSRKVSVEIQRILPAHLSAERFIRYAQNALNRNPKLRECDKNSFMKCLLDLAGFGLEADGRLAHLLPFWNKKGGPDGRGATECQLIVDYKGFVELAMRSGNVSRIHADVVCENDLFEYDTGRVEFHKIDFKKPRGDIYASYVIVYMKDGTQVADCMSKEEVDAIRRRSKSGDFGPWKTDWAEMSKKTVFRRMSKWLQLSAEFRAVAEFDDTTELGEIERPQFAPGSAQERMAQIKAERMRDVTPSPGEERVQKPEPIAGEGEVDPSDALLGMLHLIRNAATGTEIGKILERANYEVKDPAALQTIKTAASEQIVKLNPPATEEDPVLFDFIQSIQDMQTAEELTTAKEQCADFDDETAVQKAKRAVFKQSKKVGAVWREGAEGEKGQFVFTI